MTIRYRVQIEGLREILAAFRDLPADAQNVVRDRSLELAETLAAQIRAAASASDRQSAVAARSVKAKRDRVPVITAGSSGGRKAKALLYPSNFGMKRKTGWYRKVRYFESVGRQFRPWNGGAGHDDYWFYVTVEGEQAGRVSAAYLEMADEVIRRWAT